MRPRKALGAARASAAEGEDAAPRRSTRIASLPKTEETRPAPKPRAAKKRTADDANAAGAGEEGGGDSGEGEKGKAKKAKADTAADAEGAAEGMDSDGAGDAAEELAPIDIGDTLPSLNLKNEKGEDLQVADITNERGAVLFLVPKADTPGCTTQACGFRDEYSEFSQFNYAVYCLSADSPSAQTKWQTKKNLPYSLISDPKRILISALGAGEGGKTKRSHFIFEKGGKLVDKKIPVKPVDSPKFALEFIKGITASPSS